MTIESAITYFIAIFIFAITPGPGIFALLARGMTSGIASCFPLAFGMTVSDIIYLLLACFGLAAIAENWSELFTVIRIVGAVYLVYLGWKMWTTPVKVQSLTGATALPSSMASFFQGFLISASNPKVILFYIAFLPTFIDLTRLTRTDIGLVVGLTMLGLMLGLMLIAGGISTARRFFQSEKAMKAMNRSAGSLMIAAGLFLAGKG
ncbi:LysE family translocator [Salinispirillum sp. LH 10-3-1]|uniref:LysE family translocator n=1 Tax=Salinispirillum sp. LH 10-3-1 TaxID=2952525 RepID=A0AB38YJ52_9GAMM